MKGAELSFQFPIWLFYGENKGFRVDINHSPAGSTKKRGLEIFLFSVKNRVFFRMMQQ